LGNISAEHGCTCRLPGSLPTGIFRKKIIPGPVKILSHGSPGPTGNLPAGHRSTGNPGTCRYLVVIGLENVVCSDKQQLGLFFYFKLPKYSFYVLNVIKECVC